TLIPWSPRSKYIDANNHLPYNRLFARGVRKADTSHNATRRQAVRPTPRLAQILTLAGRGYADKQIAGQLGISLSTVRTHLQRFYSANGLHSRTGAVVLWLRTADTSGSLMRHSEPRRDGVTESLSSLSPT